MHFNTILTYTGVMNVDNVMERVYTMRWHRTPSAAIILASAMSVSELTMAVQVPIQQRAMTNRNTFCGTCYMPHSQFHNERTVSIIMAGCIAHARNGHISTSGLKSDVTVVFLDDDFF